MVRNKLMAAVLALAALALRAGALPAFPGAEGYGSDTPGGRGGKVIEVTNLDDSGPGSLRAAVDASGPRIVVFRVSGTIKSALNITSPNLTIAGQSAPGDGICIKELQISTHDVVVRYLRIRRGEQSKNDALHIEAENAIVDHCTISWGGDETVNTWHGSKNITIQWCIISEALDFADHAFAATLGGVNASYHHLLFAHCTARNPSIAGNNEYQTINMDFRNNVVYNFRHRTADGKPNSVNLVNNYYKPGPASTQTQFASIDEVGGYSKITTTSWYVAGNVWHGNAAISANNASGVGGATRWLVKEPNPFAPVTTHPAEVAYEKVLAEAGASLPKRDALDARIIEEVGAGKAAHGANGIIRSPSEVGGYPELKSAEPPADADKDGMPDTWEKEKSLDPADASDGPKDRDGDGYTNVEEYLNALAPNPHATASGPWSSGREAGGLRFDVRADGAGRIKVAGRDGDGGFQIFGEHGRLLFQGRLQGGRGEFDAGSWPSGTYFIRAGDRVGIWRN